MESRYMQLGVSAAKEEVKEAVKSQDKGLFPGAFCKIVPDFLNDPAYCMLLHADGAGTKSILAYLSYRENKDPSVFRGIAQDSCVMNTDDLLCVGARGPFYLSNTIGRDALRIPAEVLREVISGYDDFVALMKRFGIEIIPTGGETADVGDLVRTIICDSTLMARMKMSEVVDCDRIRPNLVIVGLASFGQSILEDKENSGIASNGLTLARHVLLHSDYRKLYPESCSDALKEGAAYFGKYKLSDPLPGSSLTVGQALLSPTRTYLPLVGEILENHFSHIYGLIHCTGGGQIKCSHFSRNIRYVKDNLFPRPAIFEAISDSKLVSEREMYQAFNMGHLMEIYCDETAAPGIISLAEQYGIEAKVIGCTEHSSYVSNEVIINDRGQSFEYRTE